jgi:hypothetical protein
MGHVYKKVLQDKIILKCSVIYQLRYIYASVNCKFAPAFQVSVGGSIITHLHGW